jgi:short-subunit dehydrogenase
LRGKQAPLPGSENPLRVFITGANSGIGAALARWYAEQGAVLGLVARRADALNGITSKISIKTYSYVADVRDAGQMARAAQAFLTDAGCPDIVIANAGVSVGTLTEHAEDAEIFRAVLETNLLGALHTFQPFVPAMQAARRGKLVGIASVAGYRGLPGAGAYSASKAGLIAYLESLRVELRPAGVRVITICPGYIETPMTANNPYVMPFMMSAETAAQEIARMVAADKTYVVIPWQMALVARVMRVLPNWLYDRLAQGRQRKPRAAITRR